MKEKYEELKQTCAELGEKLGSEFMIFAFEIIKKRISDDNQESYSKKEIVDLMNDMIETLQQEGSN